MNKQILKLVFLFALFAIAIKPACAKGKEKRLEKLYSKGKYEKCYKKCNRIIRRKLTPLPYYYISFINFQNFKSSQIDSTKISDIFLHSTISGLSFAVEVDSNAVFKEKYAERLLEIKDTLIAENSYLLDSLKFIESEFYARSVWTLFSDSTAIIARIKAIEDTIPFVVPKVVDTIPAEEEIRNLLITKADSLIGIRYTYGGATPESGFDCSGYVQYVYKEMGYKLPRTSIWQSFAGIEIEEEEALPGDLIFFY